MPRRTAADHRLCWVRQDTGHLAADRSASLAQTGVEPRNIIAFTFTEKAAAELKERIYGIVGEERPSALAEMYIGTMHGYCLDLMQRLVPETFKFSRLTDITARMFIDRYSEEVGADGLPDVGCTVPVPAPLHGLEALPAGDERAARGQGRRSQSAGRCLVESFESLHGAAVRAMLLRLHGDDQPRRPIARREIRAERRCGDVRSRSTSRPISATSSLTSTRTSTHCRSDWYAGLTRFGANLCVVGDDDQTIYQWRGSEVSNIVTFADRYPGVRQVTLARQLPLQRRALSRWADP